MMKTVLCLLASLLFAGNLFAAEIATETAPDVLLQNVSREVLEIVRQDQDIRGGNTQKTLALVETKILPHFDFLRMTRLALGREGRKATPEQLAALADEFKTMLVRTYSKALTEFRDNEIVFKPFKLNPADAETRVRTEVRQSGGKPVSLDYYMMKSATGWKVFDVEVGGVSLVTTYRSSFAEEIRNGGIDALLHSLHAKNSGAAKTAPKL